MENLEDIIKLTNDLVKIDSRNAPHAEDKIIDYILKVFNNEKLDFKVISHENHRKSLLVILPGKSSIKNLLVCGHLDTINISNIRLEEDGSVYTEIKDGKIYGLGSSDMKSGLVSMIFALKYLIKNNIKPKFDIVFAFTGDEENDRTGAIYLLKHNVIKKTKLMIIPEPTNLNLGLGQKGQIWLEARFKGKAAHGSAPDKGRNAILMAIKFIENVLDPEFFKKNNRFFSKSTVNIGFINAEGPFNVVQDSCKVGLDIRISPPETNEEVLQNINNILYQNFKKSEYELKIIDSLNASFIKPDNKAAIQIKEIVDKYASGKRKIALPYATDGSVLNTYLNIPVAILGPGTPEVIHNKDEYVIIDNIAKSIEIYKEIFLNLEKII